MFKKATPRGALASCPLGSLPKKVSDLNEKLYSYLEKCRFSEKLIKSCSLNFLQT